MGPESKASKITSEEGFDFQVLDMDNLMLKDVKKCAYESLITVKAKVKTKSTTARKGALSYQALAVADSTESMKVMLWKEHVESSDK